MKKSLAIVLVALMALPTLRAAQTSKQKLAPKKHQVSLVKSTVPVKHEEKSTKRAYDELLISELVNEDSNRWTDRMRTHIAVSGFVTQVTKEDDGDMDIRICENPKVDGMDRARCVVAKCIPKLPCDAPPIGKPITVKGISRYDAKAGNHFWEIHPVEQIDK
ncbi:MAG TPA: hypothetical protein VOA64_04315 [Candidatus Dormibacteraeota bacterium]|nr:hypothetical protein [Candidatus Dormibacteraeota bacterium]